MLSVFGVTGLIELAEFLSNSFRNVSRRKGSRRHQIELLEVRTLLAATPIISEFLASNSGGIQDSDGETSDWIELYNPTSSAVDLAGWTLTDSANDLNQWTFPSVSIGANQFLTVFASGKNRTIGGELHTNFRLSASGEYLALVNPSGVAVSEFAPNFPAQVGNVSYGVRFDTNRLITPGAAAQIFVPTNGSLGTTWTNTSFNASSWTSGTTGVGFGIVQPGFAVQYVRSNASTFLDNLSIARNVLTTPSLQGSVTYASAPVVNYLGNGGAGNFASDLPFPTQSIGDDIDDFLIEATGTITIPSSGNWTFGVNSDDGFGLRLERNGVIFTSEFPDPRGASDTLATFNIPTAGDWNVSLVIYERAGGASGEFFAASGSHTSFGSGTFRLVGDTASGGLSTYSAIGAGSSVVLGTDVGASMSNQRSSVYVRVPFQVANPASFDSLLMKMRYDDGFVAWLNGVEVARRNVSGTVSFNSVATTDRDLLAATTAETINLTPFLSLLTTGTNVLAIQGLNSSITDSSLLVLPELTASAAYVDQLRYFATSTPNDPNRGDVLGIVDRVTASVNAGFYNAPFNVTLGVPTPGAQIRFTLDGSEPTTTNGIVYSSAVSIDKTTTLRAAAFRNDYLSLPSITRSYLFVNDVIQQSPSDDVAGGFPDSGAAPMGWPTTWGNNVVDYGIDQTIVNREGAERVKNALLSIPTMSITTDLDDLFGPLGIYSNAYNDGRDWERPASLELLNPDGAQGFQVNAGLRIRGGYSRSGDNPKHAFRLFFRGEYGDSSLDFPLFGSEGTNSYKKIDLRTAQNYSWSFGGDPSNSMIQDVFSRDTQRDMGQAYTRSRPYHLYLNGQYWGLYETQERAEAEYAASYFGGSAANYDVLKPEAGSYSIYATDGTPDAYQRLWQYATTLDFSNNANYFRLQGRNASGIADPSIPNEDVLVDVDNLIVYMTNILYTGNIDAPISAFLGNDRINNFFAVRDRTGREGFRYFIHDSEHTLRNANEDRNGPFPAGSEFSYFNPQYLHQQLMANAEYRLKFADAVQKYFFNDGAMTVENLQERFMARADMINLAVLAESGRWGDSKRPTDPLGRADWLNAVDQVVNGFFPARSSIFLNQLIANQLFPTTTAPGFLINGVAQNQGQVTPGSLLRFTANSGLVYYTTNGEDPRLPGGAVNPAALVYDPGTVTTPLISAGSQWKYFDQGTDLGGTWQSSSFNDVTWSSGLGEFGYGDGDEQTVVGFGPNAASKYITTYFRKSFNVTNAGQVSGLRLRLKRDDGAVVYINGVEAARSNMPGGTVTAATLASSAVGGADEQTFFEVELNPALLTNGANVIAVELHQSSANSSDLTFDAELLSSAQSNPGLILNTSSTIHARVLDGTSWSPISDAIFSTATAATADNLIITEVHYNPAVFSGATTAPLNDKDNFEFIELRNISNETLNLSGVKFTTGISFDFSTGEVTFLGPGEHVVVVKNRQAFEARYGTAVRVAGVFSGNLNNGGEQIVLTDATGAVIKDFVFDDDQTTSPPWPLTADGGGFSLTLRNPVGNYNSSANWRSSHLLNGTPGYEEADAPSELTLTGGDVLEKVPNALAGIVSAVDYNTNDSVTYSIVAGNDGAQFVLTGNQLRVGPVGLLLSGGAQRTVRIRATDTSGLWTEQAFQINVVRENEPPTIALTNSVASLGEFQSTASRIRVADIVVTDDGIGANALSLAGADASQFEIVGLSVYLRAGASLSFATKPRYNITVVVDDLSLGFGPDDLASLTLNIVSAQPRVTAPASLTTSIGPTFVWDPVPGATGYDVWVNNNSTNIRPLIRTTVSTASWNSRTSLGIGSFSFWVRAINANGGFSPWSLKRDVRIKTPVVMRQLDRVIGIPRPTISWNELPGATKYDVWISNISTGQNPLLRQTVTGSSLLPVTDLPMGVHRAWVRGIDAGNVAAAWSTFMEFVVQPAPIVTQGINATFDRTPTLAWLPVAGASSYELTIRNRNTGLTVLTQSGITGTSFTPVTPLSVDSYAWWVNSVSPHGFRGSRPTINNIFVGGRPTLTLQTPGVRPILSWMPVDGAVSYSIQINRSSNPQSVVLRQDGLTTTSFRPANPLPPAQYRAWVRAVSASGELSPWSIEVSFFI